MKIDRPTQRLTAWIACFAILLAALAPTISHALAAGGKTNAWLEICSTTANKLIQVADSQNPEKPSIPIEKSMHFEHCPFCSTHAGSLGLPPPSLSGFAVIANSPSLPILFYHAPRPLFMWAAAQSRAPPSIS
jgi:hypothetical protein